MSAWLGGVCPLGCLLGQGVPAWPGGACLAGGVCLARGCLPEQGGLPRGVPEQGGVCPWGCLPRVGVSARGVCPGGCLPGQGVSAQGSVCLPRDVSAWPGGGVSAQGDTSPCGQNGRHLWKHNLSATTVVDGNNKIDRK